MNNTVENKNMFVPESDEMPAKTASGKNDDAEVQDLCQYLAEVFNSLLSR